MRPDAPLSPREYAARIVAQTIRRLPSGETPWDQVGLVVVDALVSAGVLDGPDLTAATEQRGRAMVVALAASLRVREGRWIRGVPSHVLAEFVTELESSGWVLAPARRTPGELPPRVRALLVDVASGAGEAARQEAHRLLTRYPPEERCRCSAQAFSEDCPWARSIGGQLLGHVRSCPQSGAPCPCSEGSTAHAMCWRATHSAGTRGGVADAL